MIKQFQQIYRLTVQTTLFVSLIVMTSLLVSCDTYLTDDPKSQLTPDQAYSSVNNLKKNALLTIYNYIGGHEESQGLQGTSKGVYDLNSLTTDEQIIPIRGGDWYDGGLWLRLYLHEWTTGEGPLKKTWDYLFKVVMLCNEGIERIDAYQTTKEDELAQLASYKAEIRALRAMFYYYLMDLYGRVPLVTTTTVKSSELTLSKRSEVFYWIYNEFNESMPDLTAEWSQFPNTEYYGRMTVFVAYFVMMKLALNAEIYTDDNWTDKQYPDGKEIRLKTLDYFSNEMDEGNAWQTVLGILNTINVFYQLSDEYSMNFDVNNETSKENIFVIPMDPLLYSNKYDYFFRSRHYCHGAALGGGAENGACATLSTVKAFGYTGTDSRPDPRFDYNFYYDQVLVHGNMVYEDDGKTPLVYHPLSVVDFDLSGLEDEKTAGARLAKYSIDATSRDDGRLGKNDIVLFRFADVLLMCAEAAYRLGEKDLALFLLNKVCSRSNLETYNTIDDDVLLTERLKELMWEGWRRNDLIRFRRYHLSYDLKVDVDAEADAHTTVFPIPADMMVMHPDWKQNPGY